MPTPAFVHLRLHSEYSVTDGIVRIDQAVERAAADGMPAPAVFLDSDSTGANLRQPVLITFKP